VTRDPRRAGPKFGGAVRCVPAADVLARKERFDAVINLAGTPLVGLPWTRACKRVLLQSRFTPIHDLLRFVSRAQNRPRVWLQASAISYHG